MRRARQFANQAESSTVCACCRSDRRRTAARGYVRGMAPSRLRTAPIRAVAPGTKYSATGSSGIASTTSMPCCTGTPSTIWPQTRAGVMEVDNLMTHLLDNHYRIIDLDGEVTQYGHVGIDPDRRATQYYLKTYSRTLTR